MLNTLINKKIQESLQFHFNLFPINRATRRFIDHNLKVWADWKVYGAESEILVDFFHPSQAMIAYSYFVNVLARKQNSRIKTFARGSVYKNPVLYKVYQSFNTTDFVVPVLDRHQKMRAESISKEIKSKIKTKQDVFDITVRGIWMGIDIYESYLRKFNQPTVRLNDPRLFDLIDKAAALLIFWTDYLESHKVTAIIISHDAYIDFDILLKLAYGKKIPAYLPNILGVSYVDKPHSIYCPRFYNYRKMFHALPAEEQKSAIELAKGQLDRRLRGEVGVDMNYSLKSAFRPFDGEKPILEKNNKIKVLICSHCFFDNPHGYGGMMFVDFYEWLCFLGRISEKTDYDWYLKMHPDALPGTEEVIREILSKFPRIEFIPPETSQLQLVQEGIKFVLTVFGTVGHELPALDVQVINAGYNPHIAYDFNWHPKSLEEYENLLMNLDKLHKQINMQDLYEFYYIHYYYTIADDLFLDSYKQFLKDLNPKQQIGPETYDYFLDQLTKAKHELIIQNINNFIDSGKYYYFSHGPA